jgi:SAM-dependent methyltransferase
MLDITNRYVLDFAARHAKAHPGAKVLDFGCGAGRVVTAGRALGVDYFGADVFYGGSSARAEAEASGLLGSAVYEIREGRIPFPDETFDLVTNNHVMEHVEDLEGVLREIHRVLRSGGMVLSIFPSVGVFREGHIGIPFAHWFPKNSRMRFLYTWALRSLGLGTWKEQAPTSRQWAVDKLRWLDAYTCYRPRRDILRLYGRYFRSTLREPDYIRYRLARHPRVAGFARLLDLPFGSKMASAVFRNLAFMVIVSVKEEL